MQERIALLKVLRAKIDHEPARFAKLWSAYASSRRFCAELQKLLRDDAANLLSVGKSRLCPEGCVGKIFCPFSISHGEYNFGGNAVGRRGQRQNYRCADFWGGHRCSEPGRQ